MSVTSYRVRRSVVLGLNGLALTAAMGAGAVVIDTVTASSAFAEQVDCAPVGVEKIGDQLYYVENCFGYNVYRPL